jgi:hypothetical protein
VTDSQLALLDAVHAQPLPVESVVLPLAPPAGTDADVGLSANAHGVDALPPDGRKFATVTALSLCTRTTSAVDAEPSGSPLYVSAGVEKYPMRTHETPTAAQALLYAITSRHACATST